MSQEGIIVLDTGAVIFGISGSNTATTPEVEEESRSRGARWNLESLLSGGMKVMSPSDGSLDRTVRAAAATGDGPRLSRADISVIALALDLGGRLATDDYAVQNVASVLGVECIGVEQGGITRVVRWKWLCRKCKKGLEGPGECPVCGGEAYRRMV